MLNPIEKFKRSILHLNRSLHHCPQNRPKNGPNQTNRPKMGKSPCSGPLKLAKFRPRTLNIAQSDPNPCVICGTTEPRNHRITEPLIYISPYILRLKPGNFSSFGLVFLLCFFFVRFYLLLLPVLVSTSCKRFFHMFHLCLLCDDTATSVYQHSDHTQLMVKGVVRLETKVLVGVSTVTVHKHILFPGLFFHQQCIQKGHLAILLSFIYKFKCSLG